MDEVNLSKRKKGLPVDKSRMNKPKKSKSGGPILSGSLQSTDEISGVKINKKRKREPASDDGDRKQKTQKKKAKTKIRSQEIEIDITAPAPPSKKALRLQKKGKPIQPQTSVQPSPILQPTATKIDTTHPDRKKFVKETPRAEFSVWIGNLPYKLDIKALRGWLVQGDKRVTDKEITRMNLPLNADGQSKG